MAITYPVKIYWKKGDVLTEWNKACITLIETFGLPGNQNYTVGLTSDYILLDFLKEKDAIHAMLIL